ncbi:FAD-dependent monooxygenase [Aeromicrobium endophyticum]|uniref:Monooxygenase n=1 Tax=Aeromicrobium endophyticum TaxID=2292704 RepID=A0A371PAZ0_9ACTN|nr:FAD-dependent monooxygenase [Aeromicrobium endophyticum]REK73077.1 monooxygenase [Aeromicrobium endophyticum]
MDVVISGASVAGLTTAHLLASAGHAVTVVERAQAPRQGGVAVDVRGAAVDVARRMGLLDAIASARVTYEDRFDFVDPDGRVQATIRPNIDLYDSPDDIEISRDALSDILRGSVPDAVRFVYGSWIEHVTESAAGVSVELHGRGTVRADLVVGADGMHSRVRQLVFGPEEQYLHHLGLYVAVLRRTSQGSGVHGSEVFNVPGRMLMLRGDGADCSALLGFRSERIDYDYRDVDQHKSMVADAFRDVTGWKVPAVLGEVDRSDDLYFDSVSQIRMTSRVSGRAVLVGDAGYCASFFSGMGTSLAMVGAATLADVLDECDDVPSALRMYDARIAPVVEAAQDLAGDGAAILFPATPEAIAARNADLAVTASS